MLMCRGVDAHDPQRSKLAFALAPIAVGVFACLDDGLLRHLERAATGTVVTLRLF
jgi:hypothetical protein